MTYVYEYPRTADDDFDEGAYYAALTETQYATTLTGFVDQCEICGQDIDDHTGLCATHTRWIEAEPYGRGYDRAADVAPERFTA